MFAASSVSTHRNPVFAAYFVDPFVWKHAGIYYAIGIDLDSGWSAMRWTNIAMGSVTIEGPGLIDV